MHCVISVTTAAVPESTQLLAPILSWTVIIWLIAIGAAIGSFMNVVVYRLPRGLSIVHPPSQCPHCGGPVRPRDNIPVVSWILLRGRCRDCNGPVSMRYPLVEAFVAVLFGLVGMADSRFSAAWNSPLETRPALVFEFAVWGLIACHLLLLCTLICVALIHCDERRSPMRLFVPALAVGLLAPVLWVQSIPGPTATTARDGADLQYLWPLAGVYDAFGGVAVGSVVGVLAILGTQRYKRFVDAGLDLPVASVLAGIFLGARSVLALGCVAAGVFLVQSLLRRQIPRMLVAPWSVWFASVTSICVVSQSWTGHWLADVARNNPWMLLTGGLVTVAVLSLLTRAVSSSGPVTRSYASE